MMMINHNWTLQLWSYLIPHKCTNLHDFGIFNINHINLILLVSLQINAVCLYVPANERIIQTNANRYIKTKLCPDVKGKHANPNLPRGTISEVYLDWLTPTNGYTSKRQGSQLLYLCETPAFQSVISSAYVHIYHVK